MASVKSTTIRNQLLSTIAIWLGLLGILALLSGCDGKAAPTAEVLPKAVRVQMTELMPAAQAVRYAAVIRPRIEADIGFRVGGKIVERRVDVGTRVTPGMVLARLDPADLELQVNAMQAQLASAQADEINAKEDFDRYGHLRKGEWTTQQEMDKRRATLDRTRAKVKEIEAQLRVTSNSERYTKLTADAAGVITAVLVEPGQVVAQGQPVVRIARDGEMEAVASIPEQAVADFARADMGVEFWAAPGLHLTGKLREISPMADASTRTFQVRVTLVDPPPEIRLGMTATLVASSAAAGSFARLPITALTQQGTDAAVWVLNAQRNGLELRRVQVAQYDSEQMLVSDGLKDGEVVVTAGVHKLTEADKVRPWTEPVR